MLLTIILNVKFASILRYVRTLPLVTKTVKTGLHNNMVSRHPLADFENSACCLSQLSQLSRLSRL